MKEEMIFEVLSPLGESVVEEAPSTDYFSDWSGKTICEVSNGLFKSGETFSVIRELLQKRYPGIKIIPYTEFPVQWVIGETQDLLERANRTVSLLKEKGCDAVIVGNGG